MRIQFSLEKIILPLRYAWRLSRNTSVEKTNFTVRAECDGFSGLGEVAPNIHYGETPDRVETEFFNLKGFLSQDFTPETWAENLGDFPFCQALKMGLDMAFQRMLAAQKGMDFSVHLDLPRPKPREIAYTIPVMEPNEIEGFMNRENLHRFSWLKVKVNKELAWPMLETLFKITTNPIAIDGNEAWTNPAEVISFTQKLDPKQVLFLEQPLPASQRADYEWLMPNSSIPIWGDESVLHTPEPEYWKAAFKGINVKLMKAGSFANAIALLKTARSIGLQTMLGCMVETSVGISAALGLESLADYVDLDGFLLIQNDSRKWVEERNGIIYPTLAKSG